MASIAFQYLVLIVHQNAKFFGFLNFKKFPEPLQQFDKSEEQDGNGKTKLHLNKETPRKNGGLESLVQGSCSHEEHTMLYSFWPVVSVC